MVKYGAHAVSTVNDERHHVLPSRITWNEDLECFEVFEYSFEGHFEQIGAGYLFDLDSRTHTYTVELLVTFIS
jgi:hypothetical protein